GRTKTNAPPTPAAIESFMLRSGKMDWIGGKVQRQTIRLLTAVGLSEAIAYGLHLYDPGWAVITAAVVTQTTISATYTNGRSQLLGAFIGGTAGILALCAKFAGVPAHLAYWGALIPLAALASWRPQTRLGPVTLTIVMLFPSASSPFGVPFERVLCVLTGVIVSMIVSFAVLREQPRRDAFREAGIMIRGLRDILAKASHDAIGWKEIRALGDACTTSLRNVIANVDEARREHWRPLESRDPMLAALPSTLRQLQTDAMVVARVALARPVHEIANVEQFERGMTAALDWIADRCDVEAGDKPRKTVDAGAALAGLPDEAAIDDQVWRFVLRVLRVDLGDFACFLTGTGRHAKSASACPISDQG
ncbi:FUSC family protein, partial [Acetobacter nitrogenifigens]